MLSVDDWDGAGVDDFVDGHFDGDFDDVKVLWSYIDCLLCNGARAAAQPSFKAQGQFVKQN